MERPPNSSIQLPPVFRFHPSDKELIVHYLRNKVFSAPIPASIIVELDLYKHNPWELPNDWVLCRVRQKTCLPRNNWEDQDSTTDKAASCSLTEHETCFTSMDPKFETLKKNLYNDCPMLPYIFASQDLSFLETHSTICIQGSNNRNASLSDGENDSEMENTEFPDFSFECLTTHSRESTPTIANTRALFPMLRGRKTQILKTRTSSYLETTPWE